MLTLSEAFAMIDASDAGDVPIRDGLTISRRMSRREYVVTRNPWFIYINGVEPHESIMPFSTFGGAMNYLDSVVGKELLSSKLPAARRTEVAE